MIIAQSAATARGIRARYRERTDERCGHSRHCPRRTSLPPLSGTFVVNGSPTQTAMADRAGARSQVAQLMLAGVVLIGAAVLDRSVAISAALRAGGHRIHDRRRDGRRRRGCGPFECESPGEFYLAVVTAATVVALGVEQGILLAIALSLFRHVRHSYRPHTMMLAPDAEGQVVTLAGHTGQGDRTGSDHLSFRCRSVLRERGSFQRRSTLARGACADARSLVRRRCRSASRTSTIRRRSPFATCSRSCRAEGSA